MSTTRKVLIAIGAIVASCWVIGLVGLLKDPHALERAEAERRAEDVRQAAAARAGGDAGGPAPMVVDAGAPHNVAAAPAPTTDVADAGPPAPPPLPAGTSLPRQTWRLGECEYNVQDVATSRSIGRDILRQRAPDGALYLIVTYTERNLSNETIHAGSYNVRLRDAQGRTFDPSTQVEVALNMDVLPELQPGITRSMRVGFELPEDVLAGSFDLIFAERGLLGSDEHRVRVVPARRPDPAPPAAEPEASTHGRRHRHH